MTHDEEQFNEMLQRMARDLDPSPEVPREEMWAKIDAARAPQRARAQEDVIPLAPRRRAPRTQYLRWALPLAAMLLLGIAIGRLTLRNATSPSATIAANANEPGTASTPAPSANPNARIPSARRDSASMVPYRLAAAQHLQRTEALLAALPGDARRGETSETAQWAGELLTDTRLLLDSPASQDPELNKLLQDLELVLAQIAALPSSKANGEVQLIEEGMNQRDVLLRLRAATAGKTLAGS